MSPDVSKSLLTRYLIKRLRECHQIYNFGAVENKDELILFFGGQRSKSQWDNVESIGTLGAIFSLISRMHIF